MILQALYDYYQRKASDPESGIAPEGFEWKEIPFVIVIDRQGRFVTIEDTREGDGSKKRARQFLVPASVIRKSAIKANLLWDNAEYALGANPRDRDDVAERHALFRLRIDETFPQIENDSLYALAKFLACDPLHQVSQANQVAPLWKEILDTNAFLTFRVEGDGFATVCDALRSEIIMANDRRAISNSNKKDRCLITGEITDIAQLHPAIKGVRGAQSAGAALSSYNMASFTSWGKEQNLNAPIGQKAVFAYTTALNTLLGKDSRNKVQVGDATTIFWAEKHCQLEDDFFSFWSINKDDPDRDIKVVETLLNSPLTGATAAESSTRFFVLGLAANSSRLVVRYWFAGTVGQLSERIRQHFLDLKIQESGRDRGSYALFFLLADIAVENKIDNIPPNLAASVMRAIFTGGPYPVTLMQQAIRRIRTGRDVKQTQAALLKACLNRRVRHAPYDTEKEIHVSLDPTNQNIGYRLGRLFAVLEKIQEDAQPGINATIRDRYYGAASSSPVSVFPQLLKLKNHHVAKLGNPGHRINHEKRLAEIIDGMPVDMPAHLALEDQARFAIGYYHQRQALYKKSEGDTISHIELSH